MVRAFADELGWSWTEQRRWPGYLAKGTVEATELHLLLPTTYMNLSGEAVKSYLTAHKIPVEALLIVADDYVLDLGEMRLRSQGSAGGHNGLKSVQQQLGTLEYKRLRMGIGHPQGQELVDYVLEEFEPGEKEALQGAIAAGAQVLRQLLQEPFDKVMTEVNRKKELQAGENA